MRLRLGCARLPYSGERCEGTRYGYSPDTMGAAAALCAARMGVESVLLSRVGRDSNGTKLASVLSSMGVDTRYMVADKSLATPLSVIIDEEEADRRIIRYGGASEKLTAADVEEGFNSYPDYVLLRLESSSEAEAAAERYCAEKGCGLFVSAADVTDASAVHLPAEAMALVADSRSMLTLTGVAPSNPDSSMRAAFELNRKCRCEFTVFRMTSGAIYLYDGKFGRILDGSSHGLSFTDVFAPAFICEYIKCGNYTAAAKFAAAAVSLWEACGETLDSVPTDTEVRRDAEAM